MGARPIGYLLTPHNRGRVLTASCVNPLSVAALASAVAIGVCGDAQARLLRINADPQTVINLPAFGATGPYLKISGTFDGELDPADAHNALIADIDLAPRTNGKVRYTSTFYILRPVNLANGNRRLFYDFGNRGNKRIIQWFNDGKESDDPTTDAEFGNGFLMRSGYSVAWSGWAGDVAVAPHKMSITLPVATKADGTPITGPVVAELIPNAVEDTKFRLPYPASTTTPTNGTLTVHQREVDARMRIADWNWVNRREIAVPAPARVQWIYEFVYDAKDPKVMGIGHAATRDFVSFLKYADKDDVGNPNPLAIGDLRARLQINYPSRRGPARGNRAPCCLASRPPGERPDLYPGVDHQGSVARLSRRDDEHPLQA
jgi:hypothetical protein